MNDVIHFDKAWHRDALDRWLAECRRQMDHRFPKIDFEAEYWPVQALYQGQMNWNFEPANVDFAGKDRSFCDVLRCLVAEMMIRGKPKNLLFPIKAFRRLATTSAASIFDVRVPDLRALEAASLVHCRQHPSTANAHYERLMALAKQLALLAKRNVLPALGYNVPSGVRVELRSLEKGARKLRTAKKGTLLDHQMEAFNDAVNAMVDLDPRLDPMDHVAICAMLRTLCAPSRVNEILCSSIDDHVTIEDYAQITPDTKDVGHSAFQMLITMKGSKGAQWSAKPVLTFMIDAFHYSEEIIKKCSKRSRMLVEWYQANPTKLYLPPELEFLRGQMLSRCDLAKIMYLTVSPLRSGVETPVQKVFRALSDRSFKAPNPDRRTEDGRINARKLIDFLPWRDAEEYLIKKIHEAMATCRKVTKLNHYEGDLSKMLFLLDRKELPYLPSASSKRFRSSLSLI